MPWVVNECGRRGATGAGRELLMFVDCVTGASFAADTAAVLPAISVRFSGLPEPPALRQCRARLVGRRVVWLGFSACPGTRTYALQFISVYFLVPAACPDWLFCDGAVRQSGSRDLAGAGVAGFLLCEQLAVR